MRNETRSSTQVSGASSLARPFSVGLRVVSLAAKFASIFFMARFLMPSDFGMYGLLAAGIGYATYIVGADFYTFSNRELIRAPLARQGGILKHQSVAYCLAYMVAIPVIVMAFAYGALPWSLLGWFLILLLVEHVGQELNRLLVALGHPATAATVMFLRTGLWPLVVVPLLWLEPASRHLQLVLVCWVASGVLALTVAMPLIARERLHGWGGPVDWAWVQRGFRVAALFLIGSLALRGLFTADRFWVDMVTTPDVLGAYVFYMLIAGALPALLEAGLFAFEYPSMVATYPAMRSMARRGHTRRLLVQTALLSVAYCIVVALFLPFMLKFLNRPEYVDHVFFLVSGLAAMFLYVMSLVPHFSLYAQGKDQAIVVGNIVAFLLFFPVTLLLRQVLSLADAVPVGLCVAFLFLFVWKSMSLRLTRRHFTPKSRLAADV